jgi:hypothetical protein
MTVPPSPPESLYGRKPVTALAGYAPIPYRMH